MYPKVVSVYNVNVKIIISRTKFALLLHLPTDLPTMEILVAQQKIVGISN
jgi:hypothetical protein